MLFLSFGGGVQSTVMLMLAIRDEIDRPEHVIFADTGWESEQTTQTVAWAKSRSEKAGIPFHVVSNGNIYTDAIASSTTDKALGDKGGRWAAMPLYVDMRSHTGRAKRQCTSRYKLDPIRRKLRKILGYEKGKRIPPGSAAVMIGISTDEARRASQSRDRWVDNVYPLIDPLKMSRGDCQRWWEDNYPNISIKRSACVGCPFKSDVEWKELKSNNPDEWEGAVVLDDAIRHREGMEHECYLHKSLTPLRDLDLNQDQLEFGLQDDLYCAGGCGL